jgi:DNA-binding NarL/FixJ family response regulator
MEGGGVESVVMQAVQLSIANGVYAAIVREALSRSCAWHVEAVDRPDPSQQCVLVLDELAFARLPLPLSNPERVVLISRKDPQLLAQAWEAGIVSVVSEEDPISTVLLAIRAAALRVAKSHAAAVSSGFSPNSGSGSEGIAPLHRVSGSRRCKTQ